MNFFEQQDASRKKTNVLIFLFGCAVVGLVIAIYLSTMLVLFFINKKAHFMPEETSLFAQFWDIQIFTYSAVSTLFVILSGFLYMQLQLSSGGASVAKMLGGKKVDPSTGDPKEKRLFNVVEEMSIASGTPMPEVFILPGEQAINAFAAGFTPSDAAIGITRGSVDLLTREELQGVVAHEFSHIFNGDMRLNIRLISLLHGILGIATIGYWVMRISPNNRRGKGNGIALIGLILLILGYIGVFFGKLIKSAVSRQREYLADASSVQFTRNPQGLSNALQKIGGFSMGSKIGNHFAETTSHMFFGDALSNSFFGLFDTHPPLIDRIRRVDPNFKGEYPMMDLDSGSFDSGLPETVAGFSTTSTSKEPISSDQVLMHVGSPETKHLEYAGAFLNSLPATLVVSAHEPEGAKATIYALLLSQNQPETSKILAWLKTFENPEFVNNVQELLEAAQKLGPKGRMPLLNICLPALRKLTLDEFNKFRDGLKKIAMSDQKLVMPEFVLLKTLDHNLRSSFERAPRNRIVYRAFSQIKNQVQTVLSVLAREGNESEAEALFAFESGWKKLTPKSVGILSQEQCSIANLSVAMDQLSLSSFSLRNEFLQAAVATISEDGKITIEEAELLRTIGENLDCPIPPIVGN